MLHASRDNDNDENNHGKRESACGHNINKSSIEAKFPDTSNQITRLYAISSGKACV